jgi:hypothetical protein
MTFTRHVYGLPSVTDALPELELYVLLCWVAEAETAY